MASFAMSDFVNFAKELYEGQKLMQCVYKNRPLLALLDKNENAVGEYVVQPTLYGGPSGGRSSNFAIAQQNQTASKVVKFLITRVKDYQLATLDNEVMLASANNLGAFEDAVTMTMDNAFNNISNSLASAIYRTSGGTIGKMYGSIAAGVITLDDPDSVVQFERGMVLQCNVGTDASPSLLGALGYVIAVNRAGGTITVSTTAGGTAGTPTSWDGASSYLLNAYGDSASKINGLQDWLPTSAPAAASSFLNVDRSVDSRLYGVYHDGTKQNIEEALISASAKVAREGGVPTHCFMSFTSFGELVKLLGAKVQRSDTEIDANIAFAGIKVHGHNSTFDVIPDKDCPGKTAFLLDMRTWKLYSIGKAPSILSPGDNLEIMRAANADAAELRVGYYGNLGCSAPGFNARIALSA